MFTTFNHRIWFPEVMCGLDCGGAVVANAGCALRIEVNVVNMSSGRAGIETRRDRMLKSVV